MKSIFLVFLFALMASPFIGLCGATINLSQGGQFGYYDMTMTIDDNGDRIINASGQGYVEFPYLTPVVPKWEKNPKQYLEYSALVQIAMASIGKGITSGKIISANSSTCCQWTASGLNDNETFQIKLTDLK